jgi:hypothetical protein
MFSSINETKLTPTEQILYSGLKQMRQSNEKLFEENIELRRKVEALTKWRNEVEQAEDRLSKDWGA